MRAPRPASVSANYLTRPQPQGSSIDNNSAMLRMSSPSPVNYQLNDSVRLTVVNETNPETIVDTMRIELQPYDIVGDALTIVCRLRGLRRRRCFRLCNFYGEELDEKSTLMDAKLYDLSVIRLRPSGLECDKDDPEWEVIEESAPKATKQRKDPDKRREVPVRDQETGSKDPEEEAPVVRSSPTVPLLAKQSPILKPASPKNTKPHAKSKSQQSRCGCCCYKPCLWISLGLLLLFLLASIFLLILFLIPGPVYEYGLVVDAGSTSSKIHLYRWIMEPNSSVISRIREVDRKCVTALGISEEESVTKANENVAECLRGKVLSIPESQRNTTNFYFGATAGMRLLKYVDSNRTDELLDHLRKSFVSFGYHIPDQKDRIRIISGQEEAQAAWISVNYLLGNLDSQGTAGDDESSSITSPTSTVGILDLGGASTQIAFVTNVSNNESGLMTTLNLFHRQYNLYAQSYLCLGRYQAQRRYLALLLKEHAANRAPASTNGRTVLTDPCMPANMTRTDNFTSVYHSPCVTQTISGQSLQLSADLSTTTQIQIVGAGDQVRCSQLVAEILPREECSQQSCGIGNVYQPPLQGKFLAVSSYYYLMKFLNLLPSSSFQHFETALELACKKPRNWTCWDGHYQKTLLKHYGFAEHNWNQIEFVDKIQGSTAGWPLGFMLRESGSLNRSSQAEPSLLLPMEAYYAGMGLAALVLLLVVLALLTALCCGRRRHRLHTCRHYVTGSPSDPGKAEV